MKTNRMLIDGNEAAAFIAHKTNEVCAIYPITPSSGMGEWADQWSSEGRMNIWGSIPEVVELQSEGGASGAVHGALQGGALTTTFTASQGLLLMIPNMYKIAGELTSAVFHVSSRSVACQALSIFADHSDVMATRATGFALMPSCSVQEAMDMALIAQAATLATRVPFIHFFDGFRTSHEINTVEMISDEQICTMIDDELVLAHRARGLSPERPVVRGTSQNPDVFFQARETVNPYYLAAPDIVQGVMDRFAEVVGRRYQLFDYFGAPDAERIVVLMASAAETAQETVEFLQAQGEKVGVIKVRLYRPFSVRHLLAVVPKTVEEIAVLDRTKEPGADGEPLYKDVVTALAQAMGSGMPRIIGGRYGLSSKEFNPGMVKAVLDELKKDEPKNHFTVGIRDDVTNSSLDFDPHFNTEPDSIVRALFYGLGSDGTVGANKNSIKIIGEETDHYAQGYFVYDSKKAGAQTISHLRFGPAPIHSTYLIQSASFVACHQFIFLQKFDILKSAGEGAVFLLNSPYGPDEVWDRIPRPVQEEMIEKKLRFYVIDAYRVAKETGMGARVNTIMQTCFFAISGVLPQDEAIEKIKSSIQKTYGQKGAVIVQQNFNAVEQSLANLYEVPLPVSATGQLVMPPPVPSEAPEFVQKVTGEIMARRGDELPVSAFPADGTYPVATTQWERRNISLHIPVWEKQICIQCGNCSLVCPHAVIRAKKYDAAELDRAPASLSAVACQGREVPEGAMYTLQSSPEDCTGCGLCVEVCPAKSKTAAGRKAINMEAKEGRFETERENWAFFQRLPEVERSGLDLTTVKDVQFTRPLFEFSGACAGCGETPYVKLLSQLFGDRAMIANATGCSSIYGGNLPTTPWSCDANGRGPAWSNSLFEDNAEFGFGFRLAVDQQRRHACELLKQMKDQLGDELVNGLINAAQKTEADLAVQRMRVVELKKKLDGLESPEARHLASVADQLVARSVWLLGGDGWAYDIGYGGLDHVLASGRNVNALVLDTEVYSNTGGQASKATPRAAVAKFAAGGKAIGKKDLGMLAMCYGNIYVAKIAIGANPRQALRALLEAEAYDGPSLIIAYSHCTAHGINMQKGLDQQKRAVECGYWPLYTYDPDRARAGKNPLVLTSKDPTLPLTDYAYNEIRYKMLTLSKPAEAERLMTLAQSDVDTRWALYKKWASPTEQNEEDDR